MHVLGSATAYRLYDVGYYIDLDAVSPLLGEAARGRSMPARLEGRAFLIPNPPLSLALGERMLTIAGAPRVVRLSATLFDFGVCSIRMTASAPGMLSWDDFTTFGTAFGTAPEVGETLRAELDTLLDRIRPAIQRLAIAPLMEDYVVFRIDALSGVAPGSPPGAVFGDEVLVRLLLGETRELAPVARRELFAHRFSYYADDLAVLTWDNALVVEPRPDDVDVEFVLEFANAQLLELRLYDAQLDAELPALYERVAHRRRRPHLTRAFRPLLAQLQTRLAEITEVVERVDNAFKITDDVYLARIYTAALELFRERTWRRGIDRKLDILRETYAMLNDEAQGARAEVLELIIVLLIAGEMIMGLLK